MWISPETLQKASPWSNPPRRRFPFLLILTGLFCLLGAPGAAFAQEREQELPGQRRAILLRGPNLIRGVPALGANAYDAQRAVYELSSGAEVELFLLSLLVPRVDEWGPFSCATLTGPGITLNARERAAGTVYAYRNEAEQRTLIATGIPTGEGACDFLSSFLQELSFFSSALGSSPLLPFPAVLTY